MENDVETRVARAASQLRGIAPDAMASDILVASAAVLHEVIAYEGCANTSTDPVSLLPSAAAHIELFPAWTCGPYWDTEYLYPDVLSFGQIHASGGQATTLHRATEGQLSRSVRHREIYQEVGVGPELRATCTIDGATYGLLNLVRREDEPDFSDDDLRVVDALTPRLAQRLRRAMATTMGNDTRLPADAGVIILDEDGDILSLTSEAKAMLDLVPEVMSIDVRKDGFLNGVVHAIWARARFIAGGFDAPEASARIRLRDGRRMTLRGTCTRTPGGRMGHTVVVLEQTRQSEIGALLLAAHGLTSREEEIVSMLLRGDSSQQISSKLGISIHTVRTHSKRIHEKLGISSRAELARLFIDEEFLPTATFTSGVGSSH